MKSTYQIKEEREEKILLSLDRLAYLSRSQIQKLHDLGSNRNACRVLKNMEHYLNYFRAEENIYYLNKTGRERIGSAVIRTKTPQYKHILMRNDLFIHLGKPKNWNVEYEIKVGKSRIITDVLFQKKVLNEDRYFFAEIDNSQNISTNLNKLRKYTQLKETQAFQQQFGYFPTIVWVVRTEHRRNELLKYGKGLKQEIYLWSDIR